MSDCLLAIFCILLLRIPHFRTLYFIASICLLVDSFWLCIIFFIFIYPFFYGFIADARHFGNLSVTLMLFVELIYLFFSGVILPVPLIKSFSLAYPSSLKYRKLSSPFSMEQTNTCSSFNMIWLLLFFSCFMYRFSLPSVFACPMQNNCQ